MLIIRFKVIVNTPIKYCGDDKNAVAVTDNSGSSRESGGTTVSSSEASSEDGEDEDGEIETDSKAIVAQQATKTEDIPSLVCSLISKRKENHSFYVNCGKRIVANQSFGTRALLLMS